jgi:CRISPR-associated protein Cas1
MELAAANGIRRRRGGHRRTAETVQLVINTFGASLKRKGDRFLIRAGPNRLAVSATKVRSVLVTTAVYISSDALELAIANNIDVVFLNKFGEPIARVWPPRMGSTAAIRRRQLEAADGDLGLEVACEWVSTKLRNQAEFLEDLSRKRPRQRELFDAPLGTIRSGLAQISELDGTLDDQRGRLLGLEGSAGRAYFACLGRLVPEGYRFDGRSRQPARDGFNAMLNYAYGVLYSLVDRACICAGLDPFLGFLHTDNYNKPSLVFDMIEPFRILAERATVLLFTGRRIKANFFAEVPGGIALSKEGRAEFLPYYNERLDRPVKYPVQSKPGKFRKIKRRDTIAHEAHGLANRLLGQSDMPRVVETRKLWNEPADQDPDSNADTEADADSNSAEPGPGSGDDAFDDDSGARGVDQG